MPQFSLVTALVSVSLCCSISPGQASSYLAQLNPDSSVVGNNPQFGYSVAMTSTRIIVGCPLDSQAGQFAGSAWLYDSADGNLITQIIPGDVSFQDSFGIAVAASEQFVCVGASGDDDNGTNAGAVYVFDASSGQLVRKLLPDTGVFVDRFGSSLAIDNGVLAVGSPLDDDNGTNAGAVYLFDVSSGTLLRKIVPLDGETADNFGQSVALSGNTLVAGGGLDGGADTKQGFAQAYEAGSGFLISTMRAVDGQIGDDFGFSVATDGTHCVVGAPLHELSASLDNAGAAYVFEVSSGNQLSKLTAGDSTMNAQFGFSLVMTGDLVIAGALTADSIEIVDGMPEKNGQSGAVYLFDRSSLTQQAKVIPAGIANNDQFGCAVSATESRLLVGSRRDDPAGSAFVFDPSALMSCAGDCERSGTVNFSDLVAMLGNFGTPGTNPGCDADGSGTVDFSDLVTTLGLFGPCP